ncbi:MAG: hypothetical protein ACR2L9_03930 [Solirubrobacteraceae bacterium]
MTDDLGTLLDALPQNDSGHSYGPDIDAAHEVLLTRAPQREKRAALMRWLANSQPCLFGRIAARERGWPRIDLCWIDELALEDGIAAVTERVQLARRACKDSAARGQVSGFLVMFSDERLARAAPSIELVRVCELLAGCLLPEWQPVRADLVYTEALPLDLDDGRVALFKASCTLFSTSAHDTVFHDHRGPGGILLNVNAVGHYATVIAKNRAVPSFEHAVTRSRELALRSIGGNGGIGTAGKRSSTRHRRARGPAGGSPTQRPAHIPHDVDLTRYCADYHTDVFVPSAALTNGDPRCPFAGVRWPHMLLDYLTSEPLAADHHNYAFMHGHIVPASERYSSPWGPAPVTPDDEVY